MVKTNINLISHSSINLKKVVGILVLSSSNMLNMIGQKQAEEFKLDS